MAAIDNIISINITETTTAVPAASFAIPLILGPTVLPAQSSPNPSGSGAPTITQNMVTCAQPSDVSDAGYETTSPEYIYAQALCSQALRPAVFKVCNRTGTNTVANDLQGAAAIDDSWYAVVCPGLSDAEILQAASQVDSMTKLFVACSGTEDIGTGSTTDVASELAGAKHPRTALLYSPASSTAGIEAAWVGGQVPKRPGSATWAYKTLVGFQPDAIGPGVAAAVIGVPVYNQTGKSANIYQTVGGVGVTQQGTTADGSFVDLLIGIDSLRSVMRGNIFSALVSNDKIPYTAAGCVIIESAIRAAIDQHVDYGFISGTDPITVTHTPIAQVAAQDRARRIAPPFQFSCRAAGAQHAVVINGSVNL